MNKNKLMTTLNELSESSKKRNFSESVELIMAFKGLTPTKPSDQIDITVNLPFASGKTDGKALLFAKDKTFISKVKDKFDKIIFDEDIPKLKKQDIAEIISYDVLLAEGPVMISVAKFLGQELAPKGKMPKPIMDLNPEKVIAQLSSMSSATRVTNKKGKGIPMVQVVVGKDGMKNEELAENILRVVEAVENALPRKKQNIKAVFVKRSMSPTFKVGD